MIYNQKININDFCDSYNPIVKSYATEYLGKIASLIDIKTLLFNDDNTKSTQEFIEFADKNLDSYISSFIYRLVGVNEIIFCRENKKQLDTIEVWKLISKSIRVIPSEFTISSIGSQGFLSIPLYKQDDSHENFDFIRLHIWDDSLDHYMDLKNAKTFQFIPTLFLQKAGLLLGK